MIEHWKDIGQALKPSGTRLLAVSKYTTDAAVELLMRAGQQDFAESRPQSLRDRALKFPDVNWHFIGPLQKNKAKYVARHADMWHSLADVEAAKAVARHVSGRVLPCLIQVNISGEVQKQGVQAEALPTFVEQLYDIPQIHMIGLMGMAAKDGDARVAFRHLRQLRDDLQKQHGSIRELCMGMSGDWRIAVEEGATMIRLGSTLFSEYPRS